MTSFKLLKPFVGWALLGLILTFGLYLVSLSPEFPPGYDSAELITACASAGIAHPPGYPLYTMLGHLFIAISPFSPAHTLNLFSAICGALTCFVLVLALALEFNRGWPALVASLAFSFARTPWRMSVGAEVFSLHLLFCACLLLILLLWQRAERERPFFMGVFCFVLALALTHHHTIVLLLPGAVIYIWINRGSGVGWRPWHLGLCFLGLLPYLWLPIRSAQLEQLRGSGVAVLNWGDPENLSNFIWSVCRLGYGGTSLSTAGTGQPLAHFFYWLTSLFSKQYLWLGTLAGFGGIGLALKRHQAFAYLWGGLFLLSGPLWSFIGAQPDQPGFYDMMERFYSASYLAFAGFIGLFLAECLGGGRYQKVALCGCSLFLTFMVFYQWPWASEGGQYFVEQCRLSMVKSVPAHSLVIIGSDLTSGFFLYENVVNKRPLIVIPQGLATSPWFLRTLPKDLSLAIVKNGVVGAMHWARQTQRPVYTDNVLPQAGGFFVPKGLMYIYLAPGEPIPSRSQTCRDNLVQLESDFSPQYRSYLAEAEIDEENRPFWRRFLLLRLGAVVRGAYQGL